MTDATPLTPEEEAALRADVAASRGTVRGWHAGAAARLLATLDAERASSPDLATHKLWCGLDWNSGEGCTCEAAASQGDEGLCWFCKRVVPVDALIAGYDTFEEQRLACLACNERMKGNWRPASQGDEGLREAASEAAQYGSTLASLLTVLPGECQQVGDACVVHNAEWSTRNGDDLGHCEWIEARTEIVPEWRSAERALRAALAAEEERLTAQGAAVDGFSVGAQYAVLRSLLRRWRDAALEGDVVTLADLTNETTDALAAASQGEQGLDVERLHLALARVLPGSFGTPHTYDERREVEAIASEYDALAAEEDRG